ncbi:MAG: rod shape-determining protein MreC [Treponema sp.]|jgi:rod shape-determining protein MreC|nr:rod shape-determining protein MreC [Treponema sp.]
MAFNKGKKKNSPLSAEAYVFAALMAVSFGLLFFSTGNFAAEVKNLGLSVFSGLRGGIYEATSLVSRTVLSIRELAILRREYTELTERIARYEQLERSAAEIWQENNRLREQLGFSQTLRYRHIPAELTGRDPDNLFSAFVINKGSRAGVAVNMPVIAYQGGTQGLVGKVVQAGAFESLVMPLYDASSFVSSRLSESRYEGITEGQGNPENPLIMRFIQKRARDEISIGEMAVSSGLGGIYPSGINIGRVSRINYQENEISMDVELEASIDFSRLEYVFVIDAAKEEADG